MIRLRWVLPMVAMIAVMAAGCGGGQPANGVLPGAAPAPPAPPAAPVSGPVTEVQAICGVQGVYWQSRWWAVDLPVQTVRDQTSTHFLSGTMTTIGNSHARLDSPDLVAPQILYMTPDENPASPPFQMCEPMNGKPSSG